MALLYNIALRIMNFMVFFLIVILLPGLPPQTTFPYKEFVIAPTKELKGALEPNQLLEGGERLLEGRVYGPEAFIVRNNEVYTGIHGGEVIKIKGEHVTHVAKIGQPCEEIFEEARCGRPLGLAFDTQGNNLIIADAYYGLWQVDLSTNKKKLLVSPQQQLPGKVSRPAKIFNGVTVGQQGDIYWTDSSSDFTIQDLVFTTFLNPSGRLFKYDRKQNVSTVLLDELFFANGVVLSPAEDFLIVAETGAMRLMKYYLRGEKAGQSEVFVEGLPGHPDNLTPDADGIWVPLVMAVDSEHPSGFVMFSQFPTVRLFLARLLALFELPFRLIQQAYPNRLAQRFVHFIGHGESILLLAPKRSTAVRVDWHGNIVGSLHGFDKSVGSISHVLEHNGQLWLGSPFNRFIARVKSPKATATPPRAHNVKITNVRYEDASKLEASVPSKPADEVVITPRPASAAKAKSATITTTTTTTPKPTTTSTTAKATTTTTKATTTTARPTTTTTTTPRPTTTTTAKPKTAKPTAAPTKTTNTAKQPKPDSAEPKRVPPKNPAPVHEEIPVDTKNPMKQEKLKVINKQGAHVEL